MTCLITWIGVDGRGVSSCYIAADSQFSWGTTGDKWNHGRKVFCSRKSPDIWGYYGDVFFPSTVVSQIIEALDEGFIESTEENHSIFESIFKKQFDSYPSAYESVFGVIHCRRTGTSVCSEYHVTHIKYKPGSGWTNDSLPLPKKSGIVGCYGSGKGHFKADLGKFTNSDVKGTSRAVFQAFCRMLEKGDAPFVGGAPQLVSLYRGGNGKQHGIVWDNEIWLAGMKLAPCDLISTKSLELFNSLFERCDPETLERIETAQPQPLPGQLTSD